MKIQKSQLNAYVYTVFYILPPPTPTDAILKLECAEIENKIHIYSVYKLNLN